MLSFPFLFFQYMCIALMTQLDEDMMRILKVSSDSRWVFGSDAVTRTF